MNILSIKTLGHLIAATHILRGEESIFWDLLMRSGVYDCVVPEVDPADLVDCGLSGTNAQELLRKPLLTAHGKAKNGHRDAHDALLEIVRLGAERLSRRSDWKDRLATLRESLLSDGYELRVGYTQPDGTREIQLLPIDPDPIPVSTEITALQAELDSRGHSEASEHYREAVKHFNDQEHSSSNGALRKMIESLVKHLAIDHTGYTDTGKKNQGTDAIKTLYIERGKPPAVQGQALPENDGGRMLHGIWQILHPGAHPGLSDADEARIRMQLCTALARFLLKHFPAKP